MSSPFKDMRISYENRDFREFFIMMTGTPEYMISEEYLLNMTIKNVHSMNIQCQMDCGKTISIHKSEVYDKEVSTELKNEFYEGMKVKTRIKRLALQEIADEFWDILKIEVTMKPTKLRNHDEYLRKLVRRYPHIENFDLSNSK